MLRTEHRAIDVLLNLKPTKDEKFEDIYGNLWFTATSPKGWTLVNFYNRECILSTAALRVINLPGLRRVPALEQAQVQRRAA